MPSDIPDFKEQMIEARRNQIVMGAARVFAEKGFHKATTKEIAQAAGVSEGTIYNYFSTKRDLLVAMIDLIAIQSLEGLVARELQDIEPGELLTGLMHNRYSLALEQGHILLPIVAEVFTDQELRQALYHQVLLPLTQRLEKYIERNVQAGRFRPVNPIIFTRAVVGAVIINFALKLSGLDPRYQDISRDALIEEITSIFLHGLLGTDKAGAPDEG